MLLTGANCASTGNACALNFPLPFLTAIAVVWIKMEGTDHCHHLKTQQQDLFRWYSNAKNSTAYARAQTPITNLSILSQIISYGRLKGD